VAAVAPALAVPALAGEPLPVSIVLFHKKQKAPSLKDEGFLFFRLVIRNFPPLPALCQILDTTKKHPYLLLQKK